MNKFATNYPIPTATNNFAVIWKLTRIMKAAGWKYLASGNGGAKDTSGTAANDLWGGAVDPTLDTYTNVSTLVVPGITTLTGTYTLTVGSTTGFPASGTITVGSTAGLQTVTYTGTSSNTFTGCTGGSGTVSATSPVALGTSVGMDTAVAWWVGSGPTTVKIPLSAVPTGSPLRGEIVTQATSSATGELFGYVWDTSSLSGWMVIGPQTGTFDNSHTITGGISSATMVPTGTVATFNREIVFAKPAASLVAGFIFYVCADGTAESAILFSSMASVAACTAVVPPGCGGTINRFDTVSAVTGVPMQIVVRGTQIAAGQFPTGNDNWFNNTTSYGSNSQIACVNNTPGAGVTADGSFYTLLSTTIPGQSSGIMFTRLDDTEPGDVDPYVFFSSNFSNNNTTFNRLVSISGVNTVAYSYSPNSLGSTPPASVGTPYYGYQSRGNPVISRDIPVAYQGSLLSNNQIGGYLQGINQGSALRTVCTPAVNTSLVRESVSITLSGQVTGQLKQMKGRCRWIHAVSLGGQLDTFDNKTWIVACPVNTNATISPCFIIGPYDGVTVPTI